MNYPDQLKDQRWKILSNKVKERDCFTCKICHNAGGILNAHHIKYKPRKMAWEYDMNDLVTLCSDCHDWVHYFQITTNEIFKSYSEYK